MSNDTRQPLFRLARLSRVFKAAGGTGYGARAGQVIRGNLARGGDGKFTSAGSASAGGKKPPRAPKKTPEQQQAERDQQRRDRVAKNRSAVRDQMANADEGLSPGGFDALTSFRDGNPLDPAVAENLAAVGMVEKTSDGSYILTRDGRSLLDAAERGDYRDAVDAFNRGTETISKRGQREEQRQQRDADREQKRQQREADKVTRQQEREQRRLEREQAKRSSSSGGAKKPKPDTSADDAKREAERRQRDAERNARRDERDARRGETNRRRDAARQAERQRQEARQDANTRQRSAEQLQRGILRETSRRVSEATRSGDAQRREQATTAREGARIAAQQQRTSAQAAQQADRDKRREALEARRSSERTNRDASREAVQRQRDLDRRTEQTRRDQQRTDDRAKRDEAVSRREQARQAATTARQEQQAKRDAERDAQRTANEAKRDAQRVADEAARSQVTTPELATATRQLQAGEPLDDSQQQALVRNGLARRNTDGDLVLTATGLRATRQKALSVFKQADGRYRWVLISSNAYRDRDNEIVSTKALEGAVALADKTGYRGPLRWWHMPGLDIGTCDFQAMHHRFLIESGTFRDEAIAVKVKDWADRLQASIGFTHPKSEPVDGIFNTIAIFERSLVPIGRAANPYTRLVVKEQSVMDIEKIKELRAVLGDEALLDRLLSGIELTAKEVQQQGVAFKAADVSVEPETVVEEVVPVEGKADEVIPIDEPVVDDGDARVYVGDMSPDEFTQVITAALTQALAPLIQAINMETKMRGLMDEMKSEVKSMFGGYVAQKDDNDARAAEEAAQRQQQIDVLTTALKEANDKQAELARGLAELQGEQPAAFKGYRASADTKTIVTDTARFKEGLPVANPANEFLKFIVNGDVTN